MNRIFSWKVRRFGSDNYICIVFFLVSLILFLRAWLMKLQHARSQKWKWNELHKKMNAADCRCISEKPVIDYGDRFSCWCGLLMDMCVYIFNYYFYGLEWLYYISIKNTLILAKGYRKAPQTFSKNQLSSLNFFVLTQLSPWTFELQSINQALWLLKLTVNVTKPRQPAFFRLFLPRGHVVKTCILYIKSIENYKKILYDFLWLFINVCWFF